ncbi:hypothetical protein [Desulfobacter sp.]
MAEIVLKTNQPEKVHQILSETLETEISRIEHSISYTKKLLKFEQKYKISSKEFMESWTAEDLEGKDMEYVEWSGEYNLWKNLNERLATIMDITYAGPAVS